MLKEVKTEEEDRRWVGIRYLGLDKNKNYDDLFEKWATGAGCGVTYLKLS